MGTISGIVMLPFMMLTAIMVGMPPDSLSLARGVAVGYSNDIDYNIVLGIGVHLFTSAVAGIIFKFAIRKVNKLKITGFTKGIGEGIVWSIILFIIMYVPTTITMNQPKLLKIIEQTDPKQKGIQNQLMVEQQQIASLYLFGFIAHLAYGVTLGCLVSLFILVGNNNTTTQQHNNKKYKLNDR